MNLLKLETSPYLLQHANNPVHWRPWSEAAFEEARLHNKPVLLSIGYSSCHWCHVMEHESFEDEQVAALMNQLYVNIKLDREEYPDIDHMYMDAVQAMTGSGGWPLNVFLTPDKKPFYGGTYFPPSRAFNRASWKEVLVNVSQYFTQNRDEVETQAEQLMQHLISASASPATTPNKLKDMNAADAGAVSAKAESDKLIFEKMMKQADQEEGGFGNAPKFPSTFIIRYLLDYYVIYKDESALKQACLSLDKMAMGGLYDQLGGGFARYSTDKFWIVPHFEKMLYDNALLIEVYSLAYACTKNEFYKTIVNETIQWLQREMTNGNGGFYSAQDADSEGIEGKYYTWKTETLKEVCGPDFELYKSYYQITDEGNLEAGHAGPEQTNILYTTYEQRSNATAETLGKIKEINQRLFEIRNKRIKPQTDDKILLGWNALMNKALAYASLIFERPDYLALAQKNMHFLMSGMQSSDFLFYHTHKDGENKIPAYLDDLASLALAFIQLHTATANTDYLHEAKKVLRFIENYFSVENEVLFRYTNRSFQQVPVNKVETYDGALPSSNSQLCRVFDLMGHVFGNNAWTQTSARMSQNMQNNFNAYPTSFALWAAQFLNKNEVEIQITIVGEQAKEYLSALYTKMPFSYVTYTVSNKEENIEEIHKKYSEGETLIFICRNYTCLPPFTSVDDAMTVFIEKKF